ncbi:hypothetical protein NC652_037460 [Populus alba x Populus x berolinensis]|nr:hypothetical protein NC652_037460 [Populus alba x Populus x berolinensis]
MEMISNKVSGLMLLIVAFTFMAAFAHSTLAVRLIPPLSDIMYAQGEANCIGKDHLLTVKSPLPISSTAADSVPIKAKRRNHVHVFYEGFPSWVDGKTLKTYFMKMGKIQRLFISRKRTKAVKRFGFVTIASNFSDKKLLGKTKHKAKQSVPKKERDSRSYKEVLSPSKTDHVYEPKQSGDTGSQSCVEEVRYNISTGDSLWLINYKSPVGTLLDDVDCMEISYLHTHFCHNKEE